MSAHELRAFLDHYVRCLNERSVDDLALIVSDELTHNGQRMTRQQWWEGPVGQHLAAVPDQTWTIEDVVIAEDRIAVRYQDSGTPTSRWIGLEPTGARISFREYVFYAVSGGRITDAWSVFESETWSRATRRHTRCINVLAGPVLLHGRAVPRLGRHDRQARLRAVALYKGKHGSRGRSRARPLH